MPELKEEMYCSQQICIPPTFPYLLRQFAKAAIRTQPNDLLKWSTTYFRCLSLNISPPVKPRLEYPIPKNYQGITPGWLRALLYQMAGSHTIAFRVLWDRWIGACLQHENLIQILCLGGFEDSTAIRWIRFVSLCAAHLTENLTQTMILICEILTEEPEGGSAMIPLETFIDLYTFLARIDASIPQTLRNYYFLDKFLELFQEKIAQDSGIKAPEEEKEEVFSLISTESTITSDRDKRGEEGSTISCPSVISQDPDNYMKLLMKLRAEGEEGEYTEEEIKTILKSQKGFEPEIVDQPEIQAKDIETPSISSSKKKEETKDQTNIQKEIDNPPIEFSEQLAQDAKIEMFSDNRGDISSRDTEYSSADDSTNASTKRDPDKLQTEEFLKEDLEKLKANQEIMGEDNEEIEKFKAIVAEQAGLVQSEINEIKADAEESLTNVSVKTDASSIIPSEKEEETVVDDREYEDVFVDAVPGIGGKVPEDLIASVCTYMRDMAKIQEGMVMPRNLRHYECPPMEIFYDRD